MFIPGRFLPSSFARIVEYDEEGRMHEYRPGSQDFGGVGDANSLYATEAEKFDSVAPFLKKNKEADAERRGYLIQPGGAFISLGDPQKRRQAEFPDNKVSFGHDTLEATKMVQPSVGRPFTLKGKG